MYLLSWIHPILILKLFLEVKGTVFTEAWQNPVSNGALLALEILISFPGKTILLGKRQWCYVSVSFLLAMPYLFFLPIHFFQTLCLLQLGKAGFLSRALPFLRWAQVSPPSLRVQAHSPFPSALLLCWSLAAVVSLPFSSLSIACK